MHIGCISVTYDCICKIHKNKVLRMFKIFGVALLVLACGLHSIANVSNGLNFTHAGAYGFNICQRGSGVLASISYLI